MLRSGSLLFCQRQLGRSSVPAHRKSGWAFQPADPHGTAVCSINANTGAITWRRTTPYGKLRGAAPAAWPDQRGFLGGVTDATDLVHLGAREYDPAIGRFVSIDPVFDAEDPQSWNGFVYGKSNPLSFSDPEGTRIPESTGSGRPWFTLEHNTALMACYFKIQSEVVRRGGDPTKVRVNYRIPGGSYQNKDSGNNGWVDIIYETDTTILVWEVKAVGQGDDLAQDSIDHYAQHIAGKTGKIVEPGFPMGGIAIGFVPGAPNGTMVMAFDGPSLGTLLYHRFTLPKPTPAPTPVPIIRPVPVPVGKQVPMPATTPVVPQPSPNSWGPYGTPLPACGGGIGCISMELMFFGILALGVGVAVAPEVTIPTIVLGGGGVLAPA
jgi:RHS repeat-associated protein